MVMQSLGLGSENIDNIGVEQNPDNPYDSILLVCYIATLEKKVIPRYQKLMQKL